MQISVKLYASDKWTDRQTNERQAAPDTSQCLNLWSNKLRLSASSEHFEHRVYDPKIDRSTINPSKPIKRQAKPRRARPDLWIVDELAIRRTDKRTRFARSHTSNTNGA